MSLFILTWQNDAVYVLIILENHLTIVPSCTCTDTHVSVHVQILTYPLILDNFLDSPLGLEDHCVLRWRCNHLRSQFHTHTKFSYHQQHQGLSTSVTCVMSVMSPRWSIVFILPIFHRVELQLSRSSSLKHKIKNYNGKQVRIKSI